MEAKEEIEREMSEENSKKESLKSKVKTLKHSIKKKETEVETATKKLEELGAANTAAEEEVAALRQKKKVRFVGLVGLDGLVCWFGWVGRWLAG